MNTQNEKILSGLDQLESYTQGKRDAPVTEYVVPVSVNVQVIRQNLNLSQTQFAKKYGFPVGTLRNWEQGRRVPEGAARTFLQIIQSDPTAVDNILASLTKPQKRLA